MSTHPFILNEPNVTRFICDNIDEIMATHTPFQGPFVIVKEFQLSNGLKVDLAILDYAQELILALFECKGEEVGIHAVLTAIGQSNQYKNHITNSIHYYGADTNLRFSPDCYVFIASGELLATKFEWDKLKFDEGISLLLINGTEKTTSSYNLTSKVDLKRISNRYSNALNFVSISPYYFRDNRFSELYLALKVCYLHTAQNPNQKLHRKKDLEPEFLNANPINPGNARNLFITLTKLGFIDNENRLTATGYRMSRLTFTEFVKEMTYDYFSPYITNILNALLSIASQKGCPMDAIVTSNEEIKQELDRIWNGKSIQYLTDSDTRYISHWLNVLRDDLGSISFEPKKVNRPIKINYLPLKGLPFNMNQIPEGPNNRSYSFLFNWLQSNNLPGAE